MENHLQSQVQKQKGWYDKYYKIMLIPPLAILAICLIYLAFFYSQHGELIWKDSSLAGGTTITLQGDVDAKALENFLKPNFDDVSVREIKDLASGKLVAVIVDSSALPEELSPKIEAHLGFKLTDQNSSTEFTGPTLSENFYRQLIIAIAISFVLMSLVIFFLFKSFIPSIAVIFAAFADIVIPLAILDFFGVKLSAAGIAAFLMLIGYSVDTDILLTTRVMKRSDGTVNSRIFGAFKTGIFMTLTGLAAILPAFFIITGLPNSFKQIFLILALGLSADIINTWLANASIIKWYADSRGMK